MFHKGSAIKAIGRAFGNVLQIQIYVHPLVKVSDITNIRCYMSDGDSYTLLQQWTIKKSYDRFLECICKYNKNNRYYCTYILYDQLKETNVKIESIVNDI
jgi:hypothetical protein